MTEQTNTPILITKIQIENFRQMHDLSLEIGQHITLIAGQNGTAKSTILGMLCQPFSFGTSRGSSANTPDKSAYTDIYHGINLNAFQNILGKRYASDCHHVFRLSRKYDSNKKYSYKVFLEGDALNDDPPIIDEGLLVKQRESKGRDIRFVTGPGASHQKGEGNFPHPVIYLGLDRLFPLAQCKKVEGGNLETLTAKEEQWFTQKYAQVLLESETSDSLEHARIEGQTKNNFLHPVNHDFNTESCSAGQDNIGQILSAIISFRDLKKQLGRDIYQGGLLVIDEIDATLHPVACEKLLDLLIVCSDELNLQIVATTHSLHLLEVSYKSDIRRFTKVIALRKLDRKIDILPSSTYTELYNNLCATATAFESTPKTDKVTILCEDRIAREFIKAILPYGTTNSFAFHEESSSSTNLVHMSSLNVPELKSVLFVIDGDKHTEIKTSKDNRVFLPGNAQPEQVIYDFMKSLSEGSDAWEQLGAKNYGKQVAFRDIAKLDHNSGKKAKFYKTWFTQQEKVLGGAKRIFDWWTKYNRDQCRQFCGNLRKAVLKIAPNKLSPDVLEKLNSHYNIKGPTELF